MPRSRSTAVTGSPAGAAETVVATLPAISVPANNPVDIIATVDVSLQAAVTTLTAKLERGSAAGGTAVATYGPATVTGGNRVTVTVSGTDTQNAEQANEQYVLTLTLAAAGGASTVNAVNIRADW